MHDLKIATFDVLYRSQKPGNNVAVDGNGGIMNANDACAKLNAGASLLQLYTGLVYRGPGLVREINRALSQQ